MTDEHRPHLRDVIADAAIAAEQEVGAHEPTEAAARAHLAVRAARVTAGVAVTLLGLGMLVLPGPGLIIVAAGLSILAVDVPFARRLLDQVKARLPKDDRGGTSKWVLAVSAIGLLAGIAGSIAFTVMR